MKAYPFDEMTNRYGEAFVVSVLENWENYAKVSHDIAMTTEERWNHFLETTNGPHSAVA